MSWLFKGSIGGVLFFLGAAVLFLGVKCRIQAQDLEEVHLALALSVEAHKRDLEALELLTRSMENTDRILEAWNADRTQLVKVRSAVKEDVKEAMQDEVFKVWGAASVPSDAWSLLGEAVEAGGDFSTSGGSFRRVPGDSTARVRDECGFVGVGEDGTV